MKEYGVIGYPLRYTLSPPMHNAAFRIMGICARYRAYPVRDVREGIRLIREVPLEGVSVTIPHKITILDLLDRLDEVAFQIGAVNTVVRKEGEIIGYNTDWLGAVKALEEVISLQDRNVLVIGAGGGARAVAYGVSSHGAKLMVTNRNEKKGKTMAHTFGGQFVPWNKRGEFPVDVVVNATPLGGEDLEDLLPIPAEALHEDMVVMDLVYQPIKTTWLKEAQRWGCKVIE